MNTPLQQTILLKFERSLTLQNFVVPLFPAGTPSLVKGCNPKEKTGSKILDVKRKTVSGIILTWQFFSCTCVVQDIFLKSVQCLFRLSTLRFVHLLMCSKCYTLYKYANLIFWGGGKRGITASIIFPLLPWLCRLVCDDNSYLIYSLVWCFSLARVQWSNEGIPQLSCLSSLDCGKGTR